MIKDGDVLMFAPMSAADEFRGAMYGNVYSIRPGYSEEAAAITRHAEALGARRLAILHGNDSESLAALDSAQRTMSSLGANFVATAVMSSGSVATSVDNALAAKPESILVIGDANGAANAVRDIRAKGFRGPSTASPIPAKACWPKSWGLPEPASWSCGLCPRATQPRLPWCATCWPTRRLPNWASPTCTCWRATSPRVYSEALRRIQRDPNRARLKKAIEGLDDVNVGGFRVHFTEDRFGSRVVELSLIDSQGKVRELL